MNPARAGFFVFMEKYRFNTRTRRILADTISPVSAYLKLRDQFADAILLESTDFHAAANARSYLCCNSLAEFKVAGRAIQRKYPDGASKNSSETGATEAFKSYLAQFEALDQVGNDLAVGFFGFTSYQGVTHFESIELAQVDWRFPDMLYRFFKYVIVFDPYRNACYLMQHTFSDERDTLDHIENLLFQRNIPSFDFHVTGERLSNLTDAQYLEMVEKGKYHCQQGDVFQLVLSRAFKQSFAGDEFQVYRALRSINPSPYLFYFDMGNFKLMGSSPEAQLVVHDGEAVIHPIAGTFRRTGDDAADAALARKLMADPKENSEHVMLVDLARNDLSRFCDEVVVEEFKEIQYFSHVIHLVSRVSGRVKSNYSGLDVFASTFPAGTLSGAPKYRALELIDVYESEPRGYYGGAIGFVDLNGNMNQAIMIRTLKSQDNQLHYRAGAGIVSASTPENELNEVYNKVAALEAAIRGAEEIVR